MKHIKLYPLGTIVCGALLLAASLQCEKMAVSEGDESPNVVLHIGSYEQTPFPARTRATAQEVCTRINYLIYDNTGERIRQEVQQVDDEHFGQVALQLPEGNYFLVILAHSSDGNPTSTDARKIGFTNTTGFTDTFLYADSLMVEDTDIELTLPLKRIVAMIRIIPEDQIPARADRIRFYYTGGSGTLDAVNNGWGVVNSKQSQFYDITHQETAFEIYTIPHGSNDHLDVTATTYHGVDDEIVSERKIEGIPVVRNCITTCRGYLFSPVYGSNFRITIDDDWDGNIPWNF